VPDAVALHHHEHSRIQLSILLERDRLTTVLTVFPRRLLFAGLPALVGIEAAVNVEALAKRLAEARSGVPTGGSCATLATSSNAVPRCDKRTRSHRQRFAICVSIRSRQREWICLCQLANRAVQAYWRAARRAFRVG
jgi:hypothetical protein